MGRTVEKTRVGNTWSEAKYFGFIRSALRRASTRWPVKYKVKEAARRRKPEGVSGLHRFEYQCNECSEWHPDKNVDVDHILEAGTLKCFDDLPGFCERLFCEADNLQVLCKPCHLIKTNAARAARKTK